MGAFGLYLYGKAIARRTTKYAKRHGTLRGSGLGRGMLYAVFAYFV